ncbi:MAG: serine protease AprX [Acidobacteriota bacterium]|nr:serine protease AprX [Acidobacteriota bacterium]
MAATSQLSEARKQVRNAYGKEFESKASDALVLSIAQPLAFSTAFKKDVTFAMGPRPATEGLGMAAAAGPPSGGGPSSVILELSRPAPTKAATAAVEAAHPAWQELSASLEKLGAASTANALSVVRRMRAAEARDAFYLSVGNLREQIGRQVGVRPETATGPQPVTQVCWLNSSMRTVAHLPTLAEVAQDSKVERIGIPRLLKADAQATKKKAPAKKKAPVKPAMEAAADVLGSVAFRTRTSLNGKDVVVAILDTEIFFKHTAFQGRVILKENYTKEPWGNPARHGTAVAGLLAASAQALTGIAPEVTVYHYKVIATDDSKNADDFGGALAIQQALEDGVHIANCSWGIGPAGDGTSREARAFDTAWDLGLVIVKSAGNVGTDGLTSPADARGVIVVGATDRSGKKVIPESSRGKTSKGRILDFVAPGGSSDDSLTSCTVDGKFGLVGFGTSYAAPQVAGLLALLLAQDRNQAPEALRTALGAFAHKLAGIGVDTQGKGLPVLT